MGQRSEGLSIQTNYTKYMLSKRLQLSNRILTLKLLRTLVEVFGNIDFNFSLFPVLFSFQLKLPNDAARRQ